MINIKWSYGDAPEKSNKNNNPINLALSNDIIDNNVVNNSYNDNNLVNYNEINNNFKNKNTYRENLNNKLNDRFMIKQINNNPFFKNSYLDDIKVHDEFLIPKSSNNDL